MTNKLALWIGTFIVIALIADAVFQGSDGTIFLLRKLADMIEWLAFWR